MRAPSEPAPLVPSRYALRGELGRGATSVVYEAFDAARGGTVALKLVHSAAVDLVGEFRLMSHLPGHPALARPLDCHATGEAGCFTMELAPGQRLDLWMDGDAARTHLFGIATALAGGLAVLHAQGFAHGDLKPANIIVDIVEEELRGVRIVDLGLSRPVRTDQAEPTSGTWRYMAPELFLGEAPGPASDLYALGVLLHECATGRPPFPAATPGDLARTLLFGSPYEPPEVPEDLAWIVPVLQRLLASRPGDRFPDAQALASALRGEPPDGSRTVRMPVEPEFCGREGELEIVTAAFDRAAAGRPVVLSLPGAPGSGRSRIVRELRKRKLLEIAGWFDITPGTGEPSPLPALARLLARLSGEEKREAAGTATSRLEPTVAGPVDLRLAERVQLLEELVPDLVTLARRERSRGVLVFLFDEQEGATDTLGTSLEYLAAEIGHGRVLFITMAGDGGGRSHEREELRMTLPVGPMDDAGTAFLVRSASAGQLTEAEVRRVVELSGGIPLYAIRLATAHAERTGPAVPELPDSLTGWLAREWENLRRAEPDALPVLEAAAVLAPRADAMQLAAVSGCDLVQVLEILARLARAGGPLALQGRAVAFHYPILAAWIEEQLPDERRAALHLAAAKAGSVAATAGDRQGVDSMARHWLAAVRAGGHQDEVVRWCHEAARKAYEQFDWDAARRWAEIALDHLRVRSEDDASLGREILGLAARAAGLAGANAEAAALFHRLAAETRDPVTAGRAVARHAHILQATLGDTDAAREAVDAALARLPEGVADLERARLLEVAADGARIRGDIEAAITAGTASLALLDRMKAEPVERSRVLATLGYARLFTGDLAGARRDLEEAQALARSVGDLYADARALTHLAVAEGRVGNYPAIRRHLEASHAIAGKIQDVRRLTAIEQSMAVADLYEARFDDARRRLAGGRRRAVAIGDRQILAYFDLTLGSVERSAGRFKAAVTALESAEKEARSSGILLARVLAVTNLGWVALLRGKLAEAATHLEAAVPEAASDPMALIQALSILSLLRTAEGNADEGSRLAREALDVSRRVGSPKFLPLALDAALRADLERGIEPDPLHAEALQGLQIAGELHVPEYMVHLLATRASLDLKAGRFEPAAASAVEARRLARSHGLLPAQVRTLEVLSSVWLARQGLYDDRAEDVLEEGTALARSIDMENDAVAMERRLESLRRSWDD